MIHRARRRSRARQLLAGVLLLTAAAQASVPSLPQPAQHEFHFVVLGDSQFHDPATFNRMVDDVGHLNPAFVIQVGDMIEGYADLDVVAREWQRFRNQIATLGAIPFVPVPGNHDLYDAQRRSAPALVALYERVWGPTRRAFDYRNARFVVLNSDAPGEERSIGPEQLRWLEARLTESAAEHVFVFMHRPPATLDNAEVLHDLLKRHPVRYVFYGHHHHYHFYERDGVRYVMTNAAADSAVPIAAVGGYDHLLLVSVRDADVRYAVIRADAIEAPDSSHPDDNQALFDLSRALLPRELVIRPAAGGAWQMTLPLENPTTRALTVYLSCDSADQRWRFEPAAVAPLTLAPGASQVVEMRAMHRVDGTPETWPRCAAQVPYQTRRGEWLPFRLERAGTPAVP